MRKLAIVTGANSGIGFETTKVLVSENIKVIMACRNMQKAQTAKNDILSIHPNAKLEIIALDLSDFDSVRTFAKEFSSNYSQLDLLINNAGIMTHKTSHNENGIESNFGTNYLGHFLLTNLLFPIISTTDHSRIVSLSSIAHKSTNKIPLNIKDLKKLKGFNAYSQSKLACLIFSYELQRRLASTNSATISVCAHPGVSITNIGQGLPNFVLNLQGKFGSILFSNQAGGAKPTTYAALNENVQGGDYYGPDGFREFKGEVKKVISTKVSKNKEIAQSLWAFSEELTGSGFVV